MPRRFRQRLDGVLTPLRPAAGGGLGVEPSGGRPVGGAGEKEKGPQARKFVGSFYMDVGVCPRPKKKS